MNSNRICFFTLIAGSGYFSQYHIQRDIPHKDQMLDHHHHGHVRGICRTDYKTRNT